MQRRTFLLLLANAYVGSVFAKKHTSAALELINTARTQIGVTVQYDPTYRKLQYPGGDVPMDKGVCTDVIIRAYRKAFNYDLQKFVHEDMQKHFSVYPKIWGLKGTDTNIDHRRVPNLQVFFKRQKAELPLTENPVDYRPGDLVTQLINNKLPHIVIVSDRRTPDGKRPLVIHNVGQGTQEEDFLFEEKLTGHYRFIPA